jgi:hypothetical protein
MQQEVMPRVGDERTPQTDQKRGITDVKKQVNRQSKEFADNSKVCQGPSKAADRTAQQNNARGQSPLPANARSVDAYDVNRGDVREYVTDDGVAGRRSIQPYPKGTENKASVRELRREELSPLRRDKRVYHNWRAKKSEHSSDQPHPTGREAEASVRKLRQEKLKVRQRDRCYSTGGRTGPPTATNPTGCESEVGTCEKRPVRSP